MKCERRPKVGERDRKNKSSINMLSGNLSGAMIRFAMPIALTSILQQLFNSADTAVVGRFSDTTALAAVGTNAEVVALLVSISSGLAVGLNVTLAWKIGKGKKEEIRRALHAGVFLAALAGLLIMVLTLLVSSPLLSLIQVPEEAFSEALLYLRLYALGLPFLLLYDFACAIERARGNSKRPLIALIFSGICNVFLNLFFVIVCRLGVAGVAIATDLSTAGSAFLTLYWLSKDQDAAFRFSIRKLSPDRETTLSVLKIGVPAALQSAVFCFANLFVQACVNEFGSVAVAGAAASMNYEYLTYYMITAFAQTATTFTGQNAAAGQHDRCRKILVLGALYALLFSAAISTPVTIFCHQAAGFYSTDPAVIEAACERIRIIVFLTPLCSLYEVPAGYLRGHGKSLLPAIETITGTCLVRILWIFTVFRMYQSLPVLYVVFPISWGITTVLVLCSVAGQFQTVKRREHHVCEPHSDHAAENL